MGYEDRTGHPPDFIARYRFYSAEEGGKHTAPRQGYRCDFLYDGDSVEDGLYMIWPEFVDLNGGVIPPDTPAAAEGVARMWIVAPDLRAAVHRYRVRVGTRFYMMEGQQRVGEGEVAEVVGLHANPGV